jgi:hypothetical protein
MKKSRFTDSQIAFILRQAGEGTSVEEVCRKAGISAQTYYRWRNKYGRLMPSEMKRRIAAHAFGMAARIDVLGLHGLGIEGDHLCADAAEALAGEDALHKGAAWPVFTLSTPRASRREAPRTPPDSGSNAAHSACPLSGYGP